MGIGSSPRSGLEHDLHALVLLVLEGLVGVGGHVEAEPVGDHEARVDPPLADVLVQRLEVAVHVALAGADRQALVHQRAGRELVHESAVDAHDRDDPARPAGEDRVAQRVAAVGLRAARLLHAVGGVQRAVAVRGLEADGVDDGVRPAPAGEHLELLDDVGVLREVDDVGRAGAVARHLEAVVVLVDRDDLLGAEQDRARDRELADRARAEDGDRLAAGDVAELGAHVAGREDVREEQDLLVLDVVLDLDRADVGERDARVLGLAAGVAAGEVRVAEDAARRVAEHLLGHPGVRIRVLADGVELVLTRPAVAARDRERHDDAVADGEVADALADLDDLAHELVPEDVAALHGRDVAVVEMQVRAADRRRGDADDRVAVVEDLGVGDVLDLHGVAARPDRGPHDTPAFSSSDASSGWAGRCLSLRSASSPSGVPSEREMTPVSTCCLKRRSSSLTLASESDPVSFWTIPPTPPPSVTRSTWISAPRSPGASLNVTTASDSLM